MPRSQLSTKLVNALGRRLAVVGVIAVLALPVVFGAQEVRLNVAGETTTVRSYADTVGELLAQQDVEVSAADEVSPTPSTALEDGLVVQVDRGDAARETAEQRRSVELAVHGNRRTITTGAETTGEALSSAGVTVGPLDSVSPAPETPLASGVDRIVVERVRFATATSTERVPVPERRRETDELGEGETRVVQEGSPGRRRTVHRVASVGGEVASRGVVSEQVVDEPTPRIVAVGTAEPTTAQQPQPAAAEAEPTPQPEPDPPESSPDGGASGAVDADRGVWQRLAECESGQRWGLDGRYDGGLQFKPTTWTRNKPADYPEYAYQASAEQQIRVGQILQRRAGWHVWGECADQLGLD